MKKKKIYCSMAGVKKYHLINSDCAIVKKWYADPRYRIYEFDKNNIPSKFKPCRCVITARKDYGNYNKSEPEKIEKKYYRTLWSKHYYHSNRKCKELLEKELKAIPWEYKNKCIEKVKPLDIEIKNLKLCKCKEESICPKPKPLRFYTKRTPLNINEYRKQLRKKIKKTFWYRDKDQLKYYQELLKDCEGQDYFTSETLEISKNDIRKGMRNLRKITESWLKKEGSDANRYMLMETTMEELIGLLKKYNNINEKLYEQLRKQIINTFKELFKKELKDSKFKKIGNIFPSQKTSKLKLYNACKAFNVTTSQVLAAHGITPCNAYNHPFFCFCGFGGTHFTKK